MTEPVKAVILAAGRGSRMLRDDLPKCLTTLGGRALLDLQLAALRNAGVQQIGVVRGFRAGMIDRPALTLWSNPRWRDTNMVATLAVAGPWLRAGEVIVGYGDIFYRSDLVSRLLTVDGEIVVAYDAEWRSLWSRRFEDPLSDAESFRLGASGILEDIGRRVDRLDDVQGQYMGLVKWSPPAWKAAEDVLSGMPPIERDRLDMTGLLRRLIGAGVTIRTVPTAGRWGELDQPGDLALYEAMLASGELRLEPDPSTAAFALKR